MDACDFAVFTNPLITASVVLQAHFLAVEALFRP